MKTRIALIAFAFPTMSHADNADVIAAKLNPGCTMRKYLQIVKDFNEQ